MGLSPGGSGSPGGKPPRPGRPAAPEASMAMVLPRPPPERLAVRPPAGAGGSSESPPGSRWPMRFARETERDKARRTRPSRAKGVRHDRFVARRLRVCPGPGKAQWRGFGTRPPPGRLRRSRETASGVSSRGCGGAMEVALATGRVSWRGSARSSTGQRGALRCGLYVRGSAGSTGIRRCDSLSRTLLASVTAHR
jgi:hypothetical protein